MAYTPTQEQLDQTYEQDDVLKLPRGFTARQIGVESGWNSAAVNKETNARGYVQLIPSTQVLVEARLGRSLDPTNFTDALAAHRVLMSEALTRYKGNVGDATSDYHAGSDRKQWGPKTAAYRTQLVGDAAAPAPATAAGAPHLPGPDESIYTATMAPRPAAGQPGAAPAPMAPGLQDVMHTQEFAGRTLARSEEISAALPPAQPDVLAVNDVDARTGAALAETTHYAGLRETVENTWYWDTLSGNLHQWAKQGEATPNWQMTPEQLTGFRQNAPAVYNNDDLRQYVQGAVSDDDMAVRMTDAKKHADFMERAANTGGLNGVANGAAGLVVGLGDPVAWVATLGLGAVVNTARAGLAINALRGGAEIAAMTAGIRQMRGQDISGAELIQQGIFGAGIGAVGHLAFGGHADPIESAARANLERRAETHMNEPVPPSVAGEGTVGSSLHDVAVDQPTFHDRDSSILTEGGTGRVDGISDEWTATPGKPPTWADVWGHDRAANDANGLAEQPSLTSVRGELPAGETGGVRSNLREGAANDEVGVRRQEIAAVETKPPAPEVPVAEVRAEELAPQPELATPEQALLVKRNAADPEHLGRSHSLKDLLEEILDGSDHLARKLASRLLDALGDDVRVHHMPDMADGNAGLFHPATRTISLKRIDSPYVLLHETAHALSAYKLHYGKMNPNSAHGRIYAELEDIRATVEMLHNADGGLDRKTKHYTKNVHELVSGLFSGNTQFLKYLAGFDWHGVPLISKLFNSVRSLLGMEVSESSALAKAMGLSEQLFDLPLTTTVQREDGSMMHVFQERDEPAGLGAFKQTAAEQNWTRAIGEHTEVRGPAAQAAQSWYTSAGRTKVMGNSVAKLFDSVGNTLARSASKGVRMVASMLGEDPSGMNRQHTMSATMDAERLKHSWRTPFMEVYGKALPKLLSTKERILFTLGQSSAAEARVGRQVAEFRLAERNARLAGTEFDASAFHPEVAYLARNLDAFWGHIHERAKEAGEPVGTALGGKGFQGHMPYRWLWADIHRAATENPAKFDALVGNFKDQYIGKVVDPAIAEAVKKGGLDAAGIAELRTALTDKAHALTENYIRQVMQDPKSRTAYETNHIAAITEDLLKNDFRGQKITNEVVAAVKRKLNEIVDARERTEFDLLRKKDGVSMLDFMDTDIGRMVDTSSQRFAGNISLARRGLADPMQIGAMRNALMKDGASAEDLSNIDFLVRSLNGELNPDEAGAATIFRQLAYSSMMGKLGFNALADVAGTAQAVGISGMFKVLGRGFLKDNGFMASLKEFSPGTLVHDNRLFNQTVDHNASSQTLVSEGSTLSNFAQKSSDWVSTLSMTRPIGKMLHNGFIPVFAEDLIKTIRTGKGISADRMGDLGLTPERIERIRGNLEAHDGARANGDALSWEKWDQLAADDLCGAIQRGTGQALQRMYVGETPRWATETSFGRMMSQFKTFGWVAAEKQTMRNVFIKDANSFSTFAVGLPIAMLMYRAKLESSMVGMSDADKARKIEQQFTENHGISALSGVLTMWNMSGMGADFADVASTLLVGQTHGTSSPAASLGYLANLKAGAAGLASAAKGAVTGDPAAVQKGLYQGYRMVPGGNLPWVTPLVNSVKP